MKKVFKTIALVAVLAAASTTANAQLYLSGNVSMDSQSGKHEHENLPTEDMEIENTFTLGTEIGYYFADNMAFGADISFHHEKEKNANDKKVWDATNMFYINPYFRFDFVTNDKISLGAKAEAILGFGKNKTNDKDLDKLSSLGIKIIPVLNYKFTPNWSAGVEFGSLSYTHNVNKDADHEKEKSSWNTWNTNLTLRSLTFSVVYTF
ncbi:MAG: porin family protein [Bacteroidales bacterium]|nr:porin family protein [Bacteroidales bacterium]